MTDTTDPVEKLKQDVDAATQQHRLARFMTILYNRSSVLARQIGLTDAEHLFGMLAVMSVLADDLDQGRELVLMTLHENWPEMFEDDDSGP